MELAPTALTAALFPWVPWYTLQEQSSFKTEKRSFLPDRWWKFAGGHVTIPESLAPTFVRQFHEGTYLQAATLEATLSQHFYDPKLFSISGAVCKRCSLCAKNNPQQGPRAPPQVQSVGRTPLENLIMDFTEMP
jgi:ADP-ribose pyrophosphatase YjhB (NUDIX family)